MLGKLVEGDADIAETIGQFLKDIVEFAPSRSDVFGQKMIIGASDLLVEFQIGTAAQTAPLRVFMKNAANEERIIADVCAQ